MGDNECMQNFVGEITCITPTWKIENKAEGQWMNLMEAGCDNQKWMELAQNRVQ
jgi:hypothetical protein